MSGVRMIGSDAALAEQVNEFLASIEPPEARWRYAAKAGRCHVYSKFTEAWVPVVIKKAVPSLSRLLGVSQWHVRSRLQRILRDGFDEALAYAAEYDEKHVHGSGILKPYLAVGPMSNWCCGHVYIARVGGYEHVCKIGFSRRVRSRLEDIASKNKIELVVPDGHLKVGTQADEHWWHRNWRDHHISGEWFFDPHMADRSLPAFLREREAA